MHPRNTNNSELTSGYVSILDDGQPAAFGGLTLGIDCGRCCTGRHKDSHCRLCHSLKLLMAGREAGRAHGAAPQRRP